MDFDNSFNFLTTGMFTDHSVYYLLECALFNIISNLIIITFIVPRNKQLV